MDTVIHGWYLREDFNPEPIQSLIDRGFKYSFIKEMVEVGNFFKARKEAHEASLEIKETLRLKNNKLP